MCANPLAFIIHNWNKWRNQLKERNPTKYSLGNLFIDILVLNINMMPKVWILYLSRKQTRR